MDLWDRNPGPVSGKWHKIEQNFPRRKPGTCCQHFKRLHRRKAGEEWKKFEDDRLRRIRCEVPSRSWWETAVIMRGHSGYSCYHRYRTLLKAAISEAAKLRMEPQSPNPSEDDIRETITLMLSKITLQDSNDGWTQEEDTRIRERDSQMSRIDKYWWTLQTDETYGDILSRLSHKSYQQCAVRLQQLRAEEFHYSLASNTKQSRNPPTQTATTQQYD